MPRSTRRTPSATSRRRRGASLSSCPWVLRRATVEDVRDALAGVTAGLAEASARQYVLRVKSLLGYANELGYTPFNAAVTIKVRSDAAHRGASLAKRIITEAEVGLLVRGAPSRRDRILLKVTYAGGLRVSEVVGLTWSDVQQRAAPGPLARGRKPIASIAARERWRQRSGVCEPKGWRKAYRAYSQWEGEAGGQKGRHHHRRVTALAVPCPRLPCNRAHAGALDGIGKMRLNRIAAS